MRVLQITNSLMSGGAEKLVIDISILLSKKNVKVDILLLDGSRTPCFESLNDYPNIKIISLGNTNNIYNPLNIIKIKKYLRKYDIIHVHLFPAHYWVAFASLIDFKKHNIILTEHNTTNRRRDLWFFKMLDRFEYKIFTKIISISDSVDKSLKHHLGNKFENIIKIYNGIDLASINNAIPYSKKELGFEEKDFLLIQVASFTVQKDHQTVINSLQKLPNNVKLLLVGKGPLKEKYMQIVKKKEIANRVFFLGVRSDVPRLLKSVDIVILSSHYEGLSLSSIEGMASGKPFIASNAPGLGDIVDEAGLLFPIGNITRLAEIVNALSKDHNLYKITVEKCKERAKKYDIQKNVAATLKTYNHILTG